MYYNNAKCIRCTEQVDRPLTAFHARQLRYCSYGLAPALTPPIALVDGKITPVSLCHECSTDIFRLIQKHEEDRLGVDHFGLSGGCILGCTSVDDEDGYGDDGDDGGDYEVRPGYIMRLYEVHESMGCVGGDCWELNGVVYCINLEVQLGKKGKGKNGVVYSERTQES